MTANFLRLGLFCAFFVFFANGSPAASRSSSCQFRSNLAIQFQPLLLDSFGSLILPQQNYKDGSWNFEIPRESSGSQFNLNCFGAGNHFKLFRDEQSLSAVCDSNGLSLKTEYGSIPFQFDQLACVGLRQSTLIENGTCYNGKSKLEVRIPENNNRVFMTICHDKETSATLYTQSQIDGPKLDQSQSVNRPDFQEGNMYPDIDADACYSSTKQGATVAELVGSQELANRYIQTSKNLFFSRGHLCPNGDGIFSYEKLSTFYFVNAVPQWQTFNGANWERLESKSRDYAARNNVVLDIYTGSDGVTTLNDVNGNPVEIWLGKYSNGTLCKKLPAPRAMWKVVHDKEAQAALAIVQFNNPYEENLTDADRNYCTSHCSSIPGVTWAITDVRLGYTLCCKVADLHKACPWAPDLGDLPLLTSF